MFPFQSISLHSFVAEICAHEKESQPIFLCLYFVSKRTSGFSLVDDLTRHALSLPCVALLFFFFAMLLYFWNSGSANTLQWTIHSHFGIHCVVSACPQSQKNEKEVGYIVFVKNHCQAGCACHAQPHHIEHFVQHTVTSYLNFRESIDSRSGKSIFCMLHGYFL